MNSQREAPNMDAVEQFEAMAEQFLRDTGYMHPGKDAPAEGFDDMEKRYTALSVWQHMREKHAKEKSALVEALKSLADVVAGCVTYAEPEVRQAIGNTNCALIKLRLREADAALTTARPE